VTRKEALQQRRQLLRLIEQWTRAEIMARLGRFDNLEYADYFRIKLDKEDEIRQLLFGESELIQLAYKWNMISESESKSRQRKKKRHA
jgi:hypothetical protein